MSDLTDIGAAMLANRPANWSALIRQRRPDLGLTQAQVAQEIGMSRQWVARFETGHSSVATLTKVLDLADALDLDVEITERQ